MPKNQGVEVADKQCPGPGGCNLPDRFFVSTTTPGIVLSSLDAYSNLQTVSGQTGGSVKVEERVSLQEAAKLLGISERQARRWIKSGKLRYYKPGLRYLIPASAIEELLEGTPAPKVLLPFDVLEVRAEVMRTLNAETGKELVDAIDEEYVRRLAGWTLEDILAAEESLLQEYRELSKATSSGRTDDDEAYQRWIRVHDELRAVTVARVSRGVPSRKNLQGRPK